MFSFLVGVQSTQQTLSNHVGVGEWVTKGYLREGLQEGGTVLARGPEPAREKRLGAGGGGKSLGVYEGGLLLQPVYLVQYVMHTAAPETTVVKTQ